MHAELQPFAKAFAEKQTAFFDAHHNLNESAAKFMRADPSDMSYYSISEEHTRTFNAWVAASHALEDASNELHEKALDLAGYPADHPLRRRRAS